MIPLTASVNIDKLAIHLNIMSATSADCRVFSKVFFVVCA